MRSIFSSIASLTETTTRSSSTIRIYCDDDPTPRWRQIDDGDRKGQWTETVNHMRKQREPGCHRGNVIKAHTNSFANPLTASSDGESAEPQKRSVISMCRWVLDHPQAKYVSPDPATFDFTSPDKKNVDNLYVLSRTILHEFTHCEPHRRTFPLSPLYILLPYRSLSMLMACPSHRREQT